MNSRKKSIASGNSPAAHGSLRKRLSAIFPSSIKNWFSNKSSSSAPDPAEVLEPEPKRRRLSGDLNYVPTTTCASTNTEPLCSVQYTTFQNSQSPQKRKREDNLMHLSGEVSPFSSENRMSYILKKSLSSGDTFTNKPVDIHEAMGSDVASTSANEKTYYSENSSSGINGISDTSKSLQDKRSSFYSPQPSLHTTRSPGSPFYPGRTTYGGIASSTFCQSPDTKNKTYTSINKCVENYDIQMSGSSKRILSLLENYSSPLGEIRRISKFAENKTSSNANSDSKDTTNKTQELQVPSIASLLSIKKKSNLMATTSTARQLLASQSSTHNCSPYPSVRSTSPRRRTRRQKIQSNRGSETYEFSPLPDNSLKISTDFLPNFTFTISNEFSLSSQSLNKRVTESCSPLGNIESLPASTSHFDTQKNIQGNNNVAMNETFSVINVRRDDGEHGNALSDQISKEHNNGEKEKSSEVADTTKSITWKCPDCCVQNDQSISQCVCCGAKIPTIAQDTNSTPCPVVIISTVSSLDNTSEDRISPDNSQSFKSNDQCKSHEGDWECHTCLLKNNKRDSKCICCKAAKPGSSESASSSSKQEEVMKKSQDEKWECKVCLVRNEKQNSKCVCCEAEKPGAEKSATVSSKNAEEKKSTEGTWECSVCLVRNEKSSSKCVCCEAVNPDAVKPAAESGKNAAVTKTNDGQWECNICLVRNEKCNSKCVCCEAEKPGSEKSALKFNFGVTANTSFKFGINPKDTNQTTVKQVETVETAAKENNNNVTPTGFSFGIPATKSNDTSLGNNDKPVESTSTFTFGIPKENATAASKSVNFAQVAPAVSSTQKDKETENNPQEVMTEPNAIAQPADIKIGLSLPVTTIAPTFMTNTPQVQTSSTSVEPTVTAVQTAVSMQSNSSQQNNQMQLKTSFPQNQNLCFNIPASVNSMNPIFGNKTNLPTTTLSAVSASPFEQNITNTVTATTTPVTNPISSFSNSFSIPAPASNMFNFGSSTNTDSPRRVNFRFGSNPSTSASVTGFGAVPESRQFTAPTSVSNNMNSLSGASGSNVTSNVTSRNENANSAFEPLSSNLSNAGSSMFSSSSGSVSSGGIFGNSVENGGWPLSTNIFSTSQSNPLNQNNRPATFNFGNNNSTLSLNFGGSSIPLFCENNQAAPMFGIPTGNNNQATSYSTPPTFMNQSSQPVNNTTNETTGGLFGASSTNTMGSFSAPRPFPEPTNPGSAFNFSAGQSSLFNFNQVPGVNASTPQFQVGSSSSTGQPRRIRKAVRRTQR